MIMVKTCHLVHIQQLILLLDVTTSDRARRKSLAFFVSLKLLNLIVQLRNIGVYLNAFLYKFEYLNPSFSSLEMYAFESFIFIWRIPTLNGIVLLSYHQPFMKASQVCRYLKYLKQHVPSEDCSCLVTSFDMRFLEMHHIYHI